MPRRERGARRPDDGDGLCYLVSEYYERIVGVFSECRDRGGNRGQASNLATGTESRQAPNLAVLSIQHSPTFRRMEQNRAEADFCA